MIEYDSRNWSSHLFRLKGSTFYEIFYRVLSVVAVAVVVCTVHHYMKELELPDKPHALVGTALGLLLVFRTNASYDRFWEGRKLWGAITNSSRNLARTATALLDAQARDALLPYVATFPYAAMHLLREQKTIGDAAQLVGPEETARLEAAQHIPLTVTLRMSAILRDAYKRGVIGEVQHTMLDGLVKELIDHVGGCERIMRTPLPFGYAVHLRRALILFLLTLPVALVGSFGWWTIPTAAVVGYIFLGVEEIGVEIENPFGHDPNDLPLEQICASISAAVRALPAHDLNAAA